MSGERIQLRSRIGESRCPLCQNSLAASGERYRCPGCATEFHAECARELGGCSTLGCSRKGEHPARGAARERTPSGRLVGSERRGSARQGAAPRFGALERLPDGRIKLELDTPLEDLWMWTGGISAFGTLIALVNLGQLGPGPLILAVVAVVLSILCYSNTDNYYLLDLEGGQLLYRRQFFSWVSVRPWATFEEIAGAAVDARRQSNKQRSWWEYALVLVLRDGRTLRVSDWKEDQRQPLEREAAELATAVGGRTWGSSPERGLRVRYDRRTGELQVRHAAPLNPLLLVAVVLACVFGAIGVLAAVLGRP
ncbi:MAG: hypothetical protein AB7N76_08435 [Planctomycetota bacterium]